jgi:tyrosine-protein kinase Etk/Wzc
MNEPNTTTVLIGNVFLESVSVIIRGRKFFVRFIVLTTIATTLVTVILPKWYQSTAVVVSAEKTSILGGLEGVATIFKSFSGSGLSDFGSSGEYKRLLGILNSERLLWNVAEKFNLQKVYDVTSYPREKTLKELLTNVNFEVTDHGSLSINVYDTDPQRAADMANFMVEQLNKINTEIILQNSTSYKKFIEQRYKSNLDQLKAAEDALNQFQKVKGVIAVEEQVEATIKASAELYSMLALREIEKEILVRTVSFDNGELSLKKIQVSAIQDKIENLRQGTAREEHKMKILIPLNSTPDLAIEYARLLREVKIQAKILEFLTPIYEQAKMEEVKNTPSVLVLDKAYPAERKAKPKIILITLLAFVLSTILGLLVLFSAEGWRKLHAGTNSLLAEEISLAKKDWFGLRFFGKKD